ncbi:MAG: polymer-forming cytoskeletal protein [Gammaproteobacteria bacterium]|nr:polymer-forming cytoskeletal protein [Gammaproteobacteria bacterium]
MRKLLMVPLAVLCASQAPAQWADEIVLINRPQTDDVYAAGRDIEIAADVEQDVTTAGQRVSVSGRVGGDLIAAGEIVIVRGEIADDIRAAGRSVAVYGKVGDHIVAAGKTVAIERGAEVGGRASLAGETVRVDGRIGRDLKAAGRNVSLSGVVDGDADIAGRNINIEPGAVVHGDLVLRSETKPEISAEARIIGQVIQKPLPDRSAEPQGFLIGLLFALGPVIAAVLIYLLFPGACVATALTAQAAPWKSLALGFAVLVLTPLAVVLLFATVFGYLLALMLLALYLFTVALGLLAGFFLLGDLGLRLLDKRDHAFTGLRVLSIIAAVAVLAVIQFVPLLGGLIGFLVWLIGLGAVVLGTYRSRRPAPAA